MAEDGRTLGELLGVNLRRLRGHRTQDELAAELRRSGLQWTRPVLASVEAGTRRVDLGELPLLLLALNVTLGDLLAGKGRIALVPGASMDAPAIRAILAGHTAGITLGQVTSAERIRAAVEAGTDDRALFGALVGHLPAKTFREVASLEVGEAEHKAARKLDVSTGIVSAASFSLWGRSLTAERNRRVGDVLDGRARQASRGHVTRALLGELRDRITQAKGTSDGER